MKQEGSFTRIPKLKLLKKNILSRIFREKNINIRELEKKLSRDPRSCHPRLSTLKTLTRTFWITPICNVMLDELLAGSPYLKNEHVPENQDQT